MATPAPTVNTDTHTPLHRALALARQALWLTSPNPRVGCVITAPDGRLLGEGHTQRAGGPHAEIMALRDAQAQGHDVRGATAWVTLEPCAHQGRTGPCCDALAAAGIGRVVAALTDPNPKVAGQGLARLQAAGAQVQVLPTDDPIASAARELNIGFFSRMERGLPWVRIKIAASIDGQTALANGQSQWITGPEARQDGHAWRARACAVLTGIGTVLEDDPLLNVRGLDVPRQPHLVVVDSRLELPLTARLLDTLGSGEPTRQIWVYTATADQADKRA
ncbi:MAG: Riboflavin biosynthesis protein RibD, partial [Pseudomonadota bacterium]